MGPLLACWRQAWQQPGIHRQIWGLALPMILSNLSVPLVNLTDTAIVGHLPGSHQLGAVAVGATAYEVLPGILIFLRMGTTGFAAQAAGRCEGGPLRQILAQALLLGLGLGLLLALLAAPLAQPLLHSMQASAGLQLQAEEYFRLRLYGLPAALTSCALIGWFIGAQNARAPLVMLLATNALNILLDLILVLGLDMGTRGAALASVSAEWSGALLGLALTPAILRQYPGQTCWATLRQWHSWRPLLAVNRDILLRSLILQAVFLLMAWQGARLGDATVAANALLLNGLLLTAFALDGLAHALEALSGHAIGAADARALRRILLVTGCWAGLASLGFALGFGLYGDLFIQLQTDQPEVQQLARIYLPWLAILPLIAVWSYLLDGLFIAATRAREMRNAMLLAALLALPVALLSQRLGNHGLWLSFISFMLLRGLCLGLEGWRLARADGWLHR